MLLNVFRIATRDEELRKAVRSALLDALYASKLSLIIGLFIGTSMVTIVAYDCPSPWLIGCAILLSLTGLGRVVTFGMFQPGSGVHNKWDVLYHAGAWIYAALIGQFTFLTILISDNASFHMLTAVTSTGYAAGAASRNTGRPEIAIGLLLLCSLPLSVALLVEPTILNILLSVTNLMFILVVIDITLQTYKTVLTAFIDREEKRRLTAVYEKLSKTDPLTGIDNRVTLKANLDALLRSGTTTVAVLWLDLDRFKQINDTLGHAAGDVVLHAVAARLKKLSGEQGKIARFGGDEFIVVVPVAGAEAALAFGEEVRRTICEPEATDSLTIDFSASIGLSISTPGQQSADDLLRHADVALYEAKAKGRNCVVIFDPEMEERLLKNKQIENDLKRAIPNGELELYFQPIIDLKTGYVNSFEALLRWHHPVHGGIPPGLFIPIAEATNQIDAITEWVLDSACAAAAKWPDDVSVCVNISPPLLKTRKLPPMVLEALLKHGLQPRRLELEITESVLVEDNPNVRVVLDGFQKLGIRLSLDDFGTGFSSLSYLCRYRFDVIKIDRSFTSDVYRSSEARAVVQAISTLADSLDLTVVAEGIETQQQLDYIRSQGCAEGQGYYFARPIPLGEVDGYLARPPFNFDNVDAAAERVRLISDSSVMDAPVRRQAGASS
jgi:diguanylate cyclase (GGDEF)-like protein